MIYIIAIIFIILILFLLYCGNRKEFFKSRRREPQKCKPLPKVDMGKCPPLKAKCDDDEVVNNMQQLLDNLKNSPGMSLVSLSEKDIEKTKNALELYKKDCSYCMSNSGGDYKCMQAAKTNLSRRIPMIGKAIYPWKNYDWDYGNYISNNYSPNATCAKPSPKIQQAYDNAMAFSKLIDGLIADPIPNKKSIASTKSRDSDYPPIERCDPDYRCTATQKVKNSYNQEKPYEDTFLDNDVNGLYASSYYFRVGDCPRHDIKNKETCESKKFTWTPNILSKVLDPNSESGTCSQPRYAFIDNSAKPFFNGSNMKGMIPAIANDLAALTPDKILGAMSGSSIANIYSIQPCYDYSDGERNTAKLTGSSKGRKGGSKGRYSGTSKSSRDKNIIKGCSKSGSSKGVNRRTKSSILGQGFSRMGI